ncbi:MAG: DUF5615 family PIN-like protein [Terriglobia bacterium]
MDILLDECVHAGVKAAFHGFEVRTVADMGWQGLTDTNLLEAAQSRFRIFVTADSHIQYHCNLARFSVGVIIVHTRKNKIQDYRPLFRLLRDTAIRVKQGQAIHVRTR